MRPRTRSRRTGWLAVLIVATGLIATACGSGSTTQLPSSGAATPTSAALASGADSQAAGSSTPASSSIPAAAGSATRASTAQSSTSAPPAQSAASTPMPAPSPVPSSAKEFDSPSGLAVNGSHLWVTNREGNSVTEVALSNGSLVRTFRGPGYGFNQPTAITSYGAYLFVANGAGFVTELRASDGAEVRTMFGPQYGFAHPIAITSAGATILVLNEGGSITELSSATGAPVRTIAGASFKFDDPVAFAVSGSDIFVANKGGGSVTEVTTGGALVHVITGLSAPEGVAVGAGYVWVSDSGTNAATQIIASTGKVKQTVGDSTGDYGFGSPSVTFQTGGNVFITTPFGVSPMVTKVPAVTGAADWYMCNTNGPYYFSNLSALAASGTDLWVASSSGGNYPNSAASTGSLTEMSTTDGSLIRTVA